MQRRRKGRVTLVAKPEPMLAAFYDAPGTIGIREIDRPTPGPTDVIVKVAACGICGTDQHILQGDFFPTYPLVGGHETVGEIVEIGAEVDNAKVGDRVAIDPGVFCGYCFFCQREQGNHCEHWSSIGVTKNGGFAEYVRAPKSNVYQIGDLPYEEAAFIEPISCVVFGLRRMAVPLGANALVYGAGTIGLLMMQLLASGNAAHVTVVDTKPEKLELARRLGANETVLADGATDARLREISPLGFDALIDCTGVPSVVEHLFANARYGAKLMFFGVTPRDATIAVRPYEVYSKDLEIYGSFALKFTFHQAIALLRGGALDVRSLITDRLPIGRFAEAIARAGAGDALKILIEPGR